MDNNEEFGRRATAVALNAFDRLVSAKARPRQDKEWTVMAAILADSRDGRFPLQTVAVATGSKCLGQSERSADIGGHRLADSHAEVVARRTLTRVLLSEMEGGRFVKPNAAKLTKNRYFTVVLGNVFFDDHIPTYSR